MATHHGPSDMDNYYFLGVLAFAGLYCAFLVLL